MTDEQAKSMIDRVDYALYQTLRGGNDPNDEGSVADAIDRLGVVLIDLIKILKGKEIQ